MYYLGLDTSNYTTSAALVNGEDILWDERIPLRVPAGGKGLRQSEALYQHWRNLPLVLSGVLEQYAPRIAAVCVSNAPRPSADSYMPVFNAGLSAGRILASALNIPLHQTSHQEGHFMAGALGTSIDFDLPLLAAHLSGGTLEFVRIQKDRYEKVGGTLDISYGQLLDRSGVLLGLDFPAGEALDKLVDTNILKEVPNPLGPVFRRDAWMNLSGTETQLIKLAESFGPAELASFLFQRLAESLIAVLEYLKSSLSIEQVLVTGGVAASHTIRFLCKDRDYRFASPALCGDNAVGVALLKGRPLCPLSH